jgi:hypothetical protein
MKLGQSEGMALQRKFRGKQTKTRENVARKLGAQIACNRGRTADPVALVIRYDVVKTVIPTEMSLWNFM